MVVDAFNAGLGCDLFKEENVTMIVIRDRKNNIGWIRGKMS